MKNLKTFEDYLGKDEEPIKAEVIDKPTETPVESEEETKDKSDNTDSENPDNVNERTAKNVTSFASFFKAK